jgi:GDP/UDP-N,N'-diacetylbacillosamine 2-epimerase (hydrolysing)
MKVGIITTSRADFGLYLPMLRKLKEDPDIEYFLFVGGMHTSETYGNSYKFIEEKSYVISEKLHALSGNNTATDIAVSMGETTASYAKIWEKYQDLDVVFCLGDRFEMFAAVTSLIPFNIPIAHISGGEVTLGAIDNKFRNGLTLLSEFHFTSTKEFADNVERMIGSNRGVYNVGSLGNEAALASNLMSEEIFKEKYGMASSEGFILTTYHPETVGLNNLEHAKELILALKAIPLRVLVTLPNADTEGSLIREELLRFEQEFPSKVLCFENLGQLGYYSAMNLCSLMIGNTSSGIVEAGAFKKWVINVGDRQKGRLAGNNVIHAPNNSQEIIKAFEEIGRDNRTNFFNPYDQNEIESSTAILKILNNIF